MNRTEELRQYVLEVIEKDIRDFEDGGNLDADGDVVMVDYITIKRVAELLKRLKAPELHKAVWRYHNDQHGTWWDCSNCMKICRKNPHDKLYCSRCGFAMNLES